MGWVNDGCQVPVQVHERDRYGHLGGVHEVGAGEK